MSEKYFNRNIHWSTPCVWVRFFSLLFLRFFHFSLSFSQQWLHLLRNGSASISNFVHIPERLAPSCLNITKICTYCAFYLCYDLGFSIVVACSFQLRVFIVCHFIVFHRLHNDFKLNDDCAALFRLNESNYVSDIHANFKLLFVELRHTFIKSK